MFKRTAVIAAWVAATFATAAITLAAVEQAGHEVSERPAVPVAVEDLAAKVSAAVTSPSSAASSSSSSGSSGATTVVTPGDGTTTSTTAPPDAPGTTSTLGLALFTESRVTAGGTVMVAVVGSELALSSAFPAQGFDVQVQSHDSGGVEVHFERLDGSVKYVVGASFEGGMIVWSVKIEVEGD